MYMNMYTGERCIIFDESGNLGSDGRYFVIACIDTTDYKELYNLMKRKLRIAKEQFCELSKLHSHEIKANEAYPCIKYHLLECIATKDIQISYIVADLHHIKPNLLENKNILYNYLMKLLLDSIISEKDNGTKINILCDNKTTKVASANSFSEYIKIHFIYDKGYDLGLNIKYLDSDSKNAYPIQAADYVANALYGWYEYGDGIFYQRFKSKVKNALKFPYTPFGK